MSAEVKSAPRISYLVASDVGSRDGIGLETYVDECCVMEIFRDDSERRTYMTVFAKDVDLATVEASILMFKDSINENSMAHEHE